MTGLGRHVVDGLDTLVQQGRCLFVLCRLSLLLTVLCDESSASRMSIMLAGWRWYMYVCVVSINNVRAVPTLRLCRRRE